jgi:hypothetical protein
MAKNSQRVGDESEESEGSEEAYSHAFNTVSVLFQGMSGKPLGPSVAGALTATFLEILTQTETDMGALDFMTLITASMAHASKIQSELDETEGVH